MSREDPQFKLRMPQALRDHLEESAKENKRSMNAEIVARLEESRLGNRSPIPGYSVEQLQSIIDLVSTQVSSVFVKKLEDVELVQVKSKDGVSHFRKRLGSGE